MRAFFVPCGLIAPWRPAEDEKGLATTPCINEDTSTSYPQIEVIGPPAVDHDEAVVPKDVWESVQRRVRRAMLPTSEISGAIVAAGLVWPSAHEVVLATRGAGTKKKGRLDHAALWVEKYVDKHTQATWTMEHRDYP